MRTRPAISSYNRVFRILLVIVYEQNTSRILLLTTILFLFQDRHSSSFQFHTRSYRHLLFLKPSIIKRIQSQTWHQQGIYSTKRHTTRTGSDGTSLVNPIQAVRNLSFETGSNGSATSYSQDGFPLDFISTLSLSFTNEVACNESDYDARQERIIEYVNSYLSSTPETLSFPDIMNRIEQEHLQDYEIAKQSYLTIEKITKQSKNTTADSISVPMYQWVEQQGCSTNNSKQQSIAIQSTEPIIDQQTVQDIRTVAESVWNNSSKSSTTSRFTYQFVGNSEVHLSDLVKDNIVLRHRINDAIETTIYPLVRSAFLQPPQEFNGDIDEKNNPNDKLQLFIYDSLVIRYNATAAAAAAAATAAGTISSSSTKNNFIFPINATINKIGAGQPLHRDLGIISVNVMLNNNLDEFVGGGTYFENQFTNTILQEPIKPFDGCGYCIAHLSSQRHAGAVTTAGVRDILVFFISGIMHTNDEEENESIATNSSDRNDTIMHAVPPAIQIAKLKQCRDYCESYCQLNNTEEQSIVCSFDCRLRHYALAINNPTIQDGESYQYLGTTFMEYAKFTTSISQHQRSLLPKAVPSTTNLLQNAIDCFLVASALTPNDSRIYNNLGIVLERYYNEIVDEVTSKDILILTNAIESSYKKAFALLVTQHGAGCNVDTDYDSVTLNYGAFLANQDRFDEAIPILDRLAFKYLQQQHQRQPIQQQQQQPLSKHSNKNARLLEDAYKLWIFCRKQVHNNKI